MTDKEFHVLGDVLAVLAAGISTAKRPGYTQGHEDVLHNFKFVAEQMGVTPMQVWGVYFLKHVMALSAYAKDPRIAQAEGLAGRFADALNYLFLGYALMVELERASV